MLVWVLTGAVAFLVAAGIFMSASLVSEDESDWHWAPLDGASFVWRARWLVLAIFIGVALTFGPLIILRTAG